mgnify:CR=1 FL=1
MTFDRVCHAVPGSLQSGRVAQLIVGWMWLALLQAAASVPELDYLYPAGGQQGSQFEVIVGGKLDPWPVGVWVDDPGLRFAPGPTNGLFQVGIAGSAAPGPHLVRFYTADGATAPVLFMVGVDPEITWLPESPAGRPKDAPRPASVPVTFNGQFKTADAQIVFPIEVEGDRVVRACFVAGLLDSPARGTLGLFHNDAPLVTTLDPSGRDFELRCPLVVGGSLALQATPLPDSHVGDMSVFRVQVTTEPLVPILRPLATTANSEQVTAFRPMTAARTLAIPGQTRGVVSPRGREIHYSFTARHNEQFHFVVRAGSVGSPLAPVLRVLDLERHVLAESLPGPDAELGWIAPNDGEHLLAVTDARGEGGPTHAFQLEVEKPQAHFGAMLDNDAFRLRPGESCICEVRVLRVPGSDMVLRVSALGLPEGVTAEPVHVPPELDQARMVMSARTNARPANGPFQVLVMTTTEVPPRFQVARFPLRARHTDGSALPIKSSDWPWLTVLP